MNLKTNQGGNHDHKELQRRQENAQGLRVLKVEGEDFFVKSAQGNFCYRVKTNDDGLSCSCQDFSKNHGRDHQFKCKHILAVEGCNGDFAQREFLESRKPKLDDRFIKNIQGKDFVLYAGLLDLAHQRGLTKLHVEALQYPTKENSQTAIRKAMAVSKSGEVFVDLGDANPGNTSPRISPHILRMASTRAKARALRDLTNIGMTCMEELGDLGEAIETQVLPLKAPKVKEPTEGAKLARAKTKTAEIKPPAEGKPPRKKAKAENKASEGEGAKLNEAQKKAIEKLASRRGLTKEDLEVMVKELYGVSFQDLTSADAANFIRYLQKSA